jgi:hypothetical protein
MAYYISSVEAQALVDLLCSQINDVKDIGLSRMVALGSQVVEARWFILGLLLALQESEWETAVQILSDGLKQRSLFYQRSDPFSPFKLQNYVQYMAREALAQFSQLLLKET